jgi:uncharacterized protein DUF3833
MLKSALNRRWRGVTAGVLACALAGCYGLEPKDFSASPPVFEADHFFEGPLHAWGVIERRDGTPTRSFTAEGSGTLEGDTVTVSQSVSYSDGKIAQRSWKLSRVDKHHYQISGADIDGTGSGECYGNALLLDYTMTEGPFGHAHVRQWLYLQPDGKTVLGHITANHLGFAGARAEEVVQRQEGAAAPAP